MKNDQNFRSKRKEQTLAPQWCGSFAFVLLKVYLVVTSTTTGADDSTPFLWLLKAPLGETDSEINKGALMKRLVSSLLILAAAFLAGCAHTYGLRENWIDDDDLKKIQTDPNIHNIAPTLGTPVFTEIHGDTLELVYNYRAHLYKSAKDMKEYKPNDKDRTNLWSKKTDVLGLLVVGNKIVGIRHRGDYAPDNQNVKAEGNSNLWLILGGIAIIGGLLVIILTGE